jgi:hypothetical protein
MKNPKCHGHEKSQTPKDQITKVRSPFMKSFKVPKDQIPKGSRAPLARGTLLDLCGLAFGISLGFGPLAFGIFNP